MVDVDNMLDALCSPDSPGGSERESSLPAVFSSASSVISFNLRRRSELDDEVTELDAVCSKHAEESDPSVRSDGCVRIKIVSFGENFSTIDWK